MSYAAPADLIAAYAERDLIHLTDPANLAAIDEARLARALTHASAEIDGYLAGRGAVPLDPVPANIALAALDIAFYRLHHAAAATVSEPVRQRFEDWIGYLRRVAEGKIALAARASAPAATPSVGSARIDAPERVFTRATLAGFQ